MKDRKNYELILKSIIVFLIIGLTVIITMMATGYITFNNKKTSQNDDVQVYNNDEKNIITTDKLDPYSKYKNFKWSNTTEYEKLFCKVFIDKNSESNLNIIYSIDNAGGKRTEIKTLPNNEKIKNFECVVSTQAPQLEYVLILSRSGNLYYVNLNFKEFSYGEILKIDTSSKVLELVRNIDTTFQGKEDDNIYALLDDGKLVKVDRNIKFDQETNSNTYSYKIGLTYEECNSHKYFVMRGLEFQIFVTNENYLRNNDYNERNYFLDENNQKIEMKYMFITNKNNLDNFYVVSRTNKLYLLKLIDNNYVFKLVDEKIISSVIKNSIDNVVIITYTDNTNEKFNIGNITYPMNIIKNNNIDQRIDTVFIDASIAQ